MLHGDVTQQDRDHLAALIEVEQDLDELSHLATPRELAKGYTALARDYYHDLAMDEEAERLLLKAQNVCPTYFTKEIKEDTDSDPDFNMVVRSLTSELLKVLNGYKITA
jgi:hypothetical protein